MHPIQVERLLQLVMVNSYTRQIAKCQNRAWEKIAPKKLEKPLRYQLSHNLSAFLHGITFKITIL